MFSAAPPFLCGIGCGFVICRCVMYSPSIHHLLWASIMKGCWTFTRCLFKRPEKFYLSFTSLLCHWVACPESSHEFQNWSQFILLWTLGYVCQLSALWQSSSWNQLKEGKIGCGSHFYPWWLCLTAAGCCLGRILWYHPLLAPDTEIKVIK